MEGSRTAFPYPPISTNEDSIRILAVKPGDFSEPLICNLAAAAFSTRPQYIALLYTWSDPYPDNVTLPTQPRSINSPPGTINSPREKSLLIEGKRTLLFESRPNAISLNGYCFDIQHNLHLALLHLRSLTHPLALWVDFICINQSNIPERNSQVAMMSFVYTRALQVVAWLSVPPYRNRPDSFRSMAIDWKAGQGHRFAAFIHGATKFHCSLEPDPKTLARLAESAYWMRIWIVQELCLARTLAFVYGSKIWAYEKLQQWKVMKATRVRPIMMNSKQGRDTDVFEPMLRMLDTRAEKYSEAMKLENLIENYAKSACSELRDRVYGLLGLANDAWPFSADSGPKECLETSLEAVDGESENLGDPLARQGMFEVDYSRSFYDIWMDAVKFMLNQTRDTDGNMERQITIVRTAGIIQQALGQDFERETHQFDVVKKKKFFTCLLKYFRKQVCLTFVR